MTTKHYCDNGKDYQKVATGDRRNEMDRESPTDVAVSHITSMMHQERETNFDKALFHSLCSDHVQAKRNSEAAKTVFDSAADRLQEFVDKFGFEPTGADKTVRCETELYQASVTRGVSTTINHSRVISFQTLCKRTRLPALFGSLFSRKVEYSLVPGADKMIEKVTVPKKYSEVFYAAYALCFSPKPKSPALKVVDLKAEQTIKQEKASAAAEKKAAKKVGRA